MLNKQSHPGQSFTLVKPQSCEILYSFKDIEQFSTIEKNLAIALKLGFDNLQVSDTPNYIVIDSEAAAPRSVNYYDNLNDCLPILESLGYTVCVNGSSRVFDDNGLIASFDTESELSRALCIHFLTNTPLA